LRPSVKAGVVEPFEYPGWRMSSRSIETNATGAPVEPADAVTRRFVFVLLEDFTLLSFAGAVDSLRLVNRHLGRSACSWLLLGEGGGKVMCSAGTEITLDGGLEELHHSDTVIVCGGEDVARQTSKPLLSWLRREARRGAAMGAFCTGSHVLAEAGLLDGKRATIHWENYDGFAEAFENVELSRAIYVIDGNRMTAAGGTASIDLMLALISRDFGTDVAAAVADS